MYYKWGKPNKENYQDVVIKYYTFFEDNFGKDILRKNSKKQLAKGNYTNSLLLMDDNFKKTISVMFSIFDDENIKFLTIYNQNHQNLGYSRVNLCAGGNKDNAIVGEIVLSDALDEQSKFTIYSAVINYLEKYITFACLINIIYSFINGFKGKSCFEYTSIIIYIALLTKYLKDLTDTKEKKILMN